MLAPAFPVVGEGADVAVVGVELPVPVRLLWLDEDDEAADAERVSTFECLGQIGLLA